MHCSHRPPCPGCPRYGSRAIAPEALKRLEELAARAGIRTAVHLGSRSGFRVRARLSARGRATSPKLGIFREGTHDIVDIPNCTIHHPLINRVAAELKASMRTTKASCYSDSAHAGLVRGVQVVVERTSERAQVVVITSGADSVSSAGLLDDFAARIAPGLHSLWWNGNPERTNRVLGEHWERRFGPKATQEILGGVPVFFPPGAFGQNNLDALVPVISQIWEWTPVDAPLLELYSGVGALSLGLLIRGQHIVFNEIDGQSLAGLRLGLEQRTVEEQARALVVPGPADEAVSHLRPESTLLVDPPRKGLSPGVLQALRSIVPARLIYLSCGLESFLSEVPELERAGLTLRALQAHDFFPFTEHVETLALFER
jgi:23S rRNA (uracil1939-C5)-methyltransferase